jgi:hypothetical protein
MLRQCQVAEWVWIINIKFFSFIDFIDGADKNKSPHRSNMVGIFYCKLKISDYTIVIPELIKPKRKPMMKRKYIVNALRNFVFNEAVVGKIKGDDNEYNFYNNPYCIL